MLGIARLRDHFQSKDHGRISQKIMFKKCSIMLCAFFKHSNHENLNFGSKSWISDIFWFFDKSELGYVVRKIHKESEFSVHFDWKFHYQPQNDVKRLDDFHLIWRNWIIWLKPAAYCSVQHMHHKIQFCSFILIYNMRPENWYIAYFRGFEIQNWGTIELFWMENI